MSKQTKTMLGMASILLVLVIAFFSIVIYSGQQERENEEAEAKKEEGIIISRLEQEKIQGFSFQVNAEDFDNEVYTFKKVGDTWFYNEDQKFPVNQSVVEAKTKVLSEMCAQRVIEKQTGDLAKYGLDDPILSVSVTNGKNVITYLLGDYNANSETYYLKIKDQNEIYTVDGSLWVGFSLNLSDLAQMDEFPEIQEDHIKKVNIKNTYDDVTFVFEQTGTEEDKTTGKITYTGTWYVEDLKGNLVKANQSKTALLMSILTKIEYANLADYDTTEEDMVSYGLKEPNTMVTIDYTVDEVDMDTVKQVAVGNNINTIEYETYSVDYQMVFTIGGSSEMVTYEDDYFVQTNQSKMIVTIDADTASVLAGVRTVDYSNAAEEKTEE